MIDNLYETHDIHFWRDYFPEEQHYVVYDPHIIYSTFKIEDVYHSIANARTNLSFYQVENYGEMISQHDEIHLTFVRSRFLANSLAYYNYAIDLSWQVLWFYWGDSSYLFMEDNDLYEKYAGLCSIKSLNELLRRYSDDSIREYINSFFQNDLTQEIRRSYNYIKHRGIMHTPELDVQYTNSLIAIRTDLSQDEEYSFSLLTKRTFELQEWSLKLIEFDKIFHSYFREIIQHVTPENFSECKPDLREVGEYMNKRKQFLDDELQDYMEKYTQAFHSEE